PEAESVVIDHENETVAFNGGPRRREIQRHDFDAFEMDVLPNIEFGPVGNRKHANAFALRFARVVEIPKFRTLFLGIPAMIGAAKTEDAFFGATFLLVATRAAERGIEGVLIERLLQTLSLPHVGVQRTVIERVDPFLHGFGV